MTPKMHLPLAAIVAMSKNRVIGKNNQLLWHLPADLKHFKTMTTGHPIIMGRKTYQSIGKPLPNRINIVLTQDPTFKQAGCIVVNSVEDALSSAALEQGQIFVIGGNQIYNLFMPYTERIYLTLLHQDFEGDTYFPVLDEGEWREVSREDFLADEKNPYDYSFLELERKL